MKLPPGFKVVSVPILDTGIGKEAGFENDADLIRAHAEEIAKLPPEVQELIAKVEAKLDREFLHGEDPK
jgi:hypothetical protein